MAAIELKFHNVEIVIRSLVKFGGGAAKHVAQVADDAMRQDVWPEWIKEINLTDHTLKDLRELGYPYSTRYGADTFAHPDAMIHAQTDSLLESSSIAPLEFDGLTARAQLIVSDPVYKDLRFGTSKMRPRDPAAAVMARALPAIKRRFRAGIRQAIIEFYPH